MSLPTQFSESLRYNYPLTPDSLVIDLGAYHGTFSATLAEKYNCRIAAYEPIEEFYQIASSRLLQYPKVKLHHAAVGLGSTYAEFGVKGDMSGAYEQGNRRETVKVIPLMRMWPSEMVDLLKLNVEGYEYPLLTFMLGNDLHKSCRNIQVQYHGNVDDAEAKFEDIHERLQETHDLTYHFPFCWTNYALRL